MVGIRLPEENSSRAKRKQEKQLDALSLSNPDSTPKKRLNKIVATKPSPSFQEKKYIYLQNSRHLLPTTESGDIPTGNATSSWTDKQGHLPGHSKASQKGCVRQGLNNFCLKLIRLRPHFKLDLLSESVRVSVL